MCLTAAGLAITPASAAVPTAAGAGATASSLHEFEGPIVHVDRKSHRFKVDDRHHGIVRIKANKATRYEHLKGFGALHHGLRVDVEARSSNGHWIAVEIERELED